MQLIKYKKKYREEKMMNKEQYTNENENMDSNDIMQYGNREKYLGETKQEGIFFEFLYNLRDENPWDEKDFNSVFMYL